jgi:GAF domain-containing protein
MSSVGELYELLLATNTLDEFLHDVALRASTEVSTGLSCGLTVRTDGRPLTIASSDGFASRLDQLQYSLDEGPCLTTLRTGEAMLDEGSGESRGQRWPNYHAQGLTIGLRSSLSVPIGRAGETFGALNLYNHTEEPFEPTHHERAHRFADNAAGGMAVAIRLAEAPSSPRTCKRHWPPERSSTRHWAS